MTNTETKNQTKRDININNMLLRYPNAKVTRHDHLKIVIIQDGDVLCIFGKNAKPYTYIRTNHPQYYINMYVNDAQKSYDNKKTNEQKGHDFKLGDIFYRGWGWEQTNITYYKIVDVKAKTFVVRELDSTRVESAPLAMSGKCIVNVNEFDKHNNKEMRGTVKYSSIGTFLIVNGEWCEKCTEQQIRDGISCSWYA